MPLFLGQSIRPNFATIPPILWSTYSISLLINFGLNTFMEISRPPNSNNSTQFVSENSRIEINFGSQLSKPQSCQTGENVQREDGCLQAALNQSLNYFPALSVQFIHQFAVKKTNSKPNGINKTIGRVQPE